MQDINISELPKVLERLTDISQSLSSRIDGLSSRLDLIDAKLNLLLMIFLPILIALFGGLILPLSIRLWRDLAPSDKL